MKLQAPEIAVEISAAFREAVVRAGGIELARKAESDPEVRDTTIRRLIESLGLREVEFGEGVEGTMSPAELCRVAGWYAFPFPVVNLLSAPSDYGGFAVIGKEGSLVDHGDLLRPMAIASIGGPIRRVVHSSSPLLQRLAPFVTRLELSESLDQETDWNVALWLTLSAWWVLGACEHAAELTVNHVTAREQFGGPLSKLQSVRFRVADLTVACTALHELLAYTTWRLVRVPSDALVDALAARVSAQETAREVFRTAHQLHGAVGFCDEHDLSVLSRHVQPYVRLPMDYEASSAALLELVDRYGLEGLYGRFQ